ncbi:hypothetical protein IC614_09770 [Allosphingosinicella flava]|uniref:Haem-binding uptake Tiki superfamily ChaN domain-containing protein n=1 Tax=Allosphingosinicella flava TaxID=2771430 RepID=A0A7T2LLK4_9SPHN|nr:hypothetical protein [Sphingosinicella flava]QPQ54610.1 hypothetical protein IC614_09770 [Sphingosinicella flava]
MMLSMLAALMGAGIPAGLPPSCGALPGIEQLLDRPDFNYLLIGEYHGTAEMPAVAADALCAGAKAGRPLILGLEFPPANQPYLDAYLSSDGGEAARTALLVAPAWHAAEDARVTHAVLALIDRARLLASRGYKVSAVAFDKIPQPLISKEREAGMAELLTAAQRKVPGSLVVALTGTGHADKEGWTSQNPPFLAAGGILPPRETVSLAFARPGGQYWGCQSPGGEANGCKAYDMAVREAVRPRGIVLDPALRGGFDGLYSTGGQYTASLPALSK